jgi:hypothetical protein
LAPESFWAADRDAPSLNPRVDDVRASDHPTQIPNWGRGGKVAAHSTCHCQPAASRPTPPRGPIMFSSGKALLRVIQVTQESFRRMSALCTRVSANRCARPGFIFLTNLSEAVRVALRARHTGLLLGRAHRPERLCDDECGVPAPCHLPTRSPKHLGSDDECSIDSYSDVKVARRTLWRRFAREQRIHAISNIYNRPWHMRIACTARKVPGRAYAPMLPREHAATVLAGRSQAWQVDTF